MSPKNLVLYRKLIHTARDPLLKKGPTVAYSAQVITKHSGISLLLS